jgi:transposase InsO family protein
MMYFKGITAADRVQFEGREVHNTSVLTDRKSKEITHFLLSVADEVEGSVVRKIRVDEMADLIESERVQIDRGYHSVPRQVDRSLYGGQELFGATRKQRLKVDRIMYLVRRMEHYHKHGMPLTREGVNQSKVQLDKEFQQFQARAYHSTDKPNASQRRFPLPASSTLLDYYRRFRGANENPNCFLVSKAEAVEETVQMSDDFVFVMQLLSKYASETKPAKSAIAVECCKTVKAVNKNRREMDYPHMIDERCARTYERWIDLYLDPFEVVMKRKGLAAARRKFKTSEQVQHATFPGEIVQYDAWMFHVSTLNVTRKQWQAMTAEERKRVKRVRRWVVMAIDVATRCILGYSICRNPDERASLEAMRMCYHDKTYLLRNAGIKTQRWNYAARHHLTVTDSGSEFGKHPFGGALFGEACRTLTGSIMNTAAGIPELKGHIERFFFTCELKFARAVPGWTGSNPSARNDRKPHLEACMTDDDLAEAFTAFIAEYHNTPHRGLGYKTPAGVWAEMTADPEFDPEIPGPKALREACGFYATAKVGEHGISFARTTYSNEFVRNQRMAPGKQRVAAVGDTVEIKVDPHNLGGISVRTPDGFVSVPCTDREMVGKSLREWNREHEIQKLDAEADAEAHAEQRSEANAAWRGVVATCIKDSDVGIAGYTDKEVNRARLEQTFGKGLHEEPFIGRDEEAADPLNGGYDTDLDPDDLKYGDHSDVAPDALNNMDRFGARKRRRSHLDGENWKEDKK